jgi:hypothetical protein
MQTFLPYPDFRKSLASLDNKRLGKQRVEALQIYKALTVPKYGWKNHPATRMWNGYINALILYHNISLEEWSKRTRKDGTFVTNNMIPIPYVGKIIYPPWFGDDSFHISHQSNLVRKDAVYYGPKFPNVPTNLEYIWPSNVKDLVE